MQENCELSLWVGELSNANRAAEPFDCRAKGSLKSWEGEIRRTGSVIAVASFLDYYEGSEPEQRPRQVEKT